MPSGIYRYEAGDGFVPCSDFIDFGMHSNVYNHIGGPADLQGFCVILVG
jgi:hypothetical protein